MAITRALCEVKVPDRGTFEKEGFLTETRMVGERKVWSKEEAERNSNSVNVVDYLRHTWQI